MSHIHGDHVGGVGSFLDQNPNVTVYLPHSFPDSFKDEVESYAAKIVSVDKPLKICQNVYSGPCHCSGNLARKLFKKAYGKDFIPVGVGKTIEIHQF